MNRLLNAYYLPNYDGTTDEIATIVGADCDGMERWLCVSINLGKIDPVGLSRAPAVVATQVVDSYMHAVAWLEEWRDRVSVVAAEYVTRHELVFASTKEVKSLLENTIRLSSHDLLTKKIAVFCVSACAGDVPLTELTETTVEFEDLTKSGPAATARAIPHGKSMLKMTTKKAAPEFTKRAEQLLDDLDSEWGKEDRLAAEKEAQRIANEEAELNEIVEEECRRAAMPAWGLFQ